MSSGGWWWWFIVIHKSAKWLVGYAAGIDLSDNAIDECQLVVGIVLSILVIVFL